MADKDQKPELKPEPKKDEAKDFAKDPTGDKGAKPAPGSAKDKGGGKR